MSQPDTGWPDESGTFTEYRVEWDYAETDEQEAQTMVSGWTDQDTATERHERARDRHADDPTVTAFLASREVTIRYLRRTAT